MAANGAYRRCRRPLSPRRLWPPPAELAADYERRPRRTADEAGRGEGRSATRPPSGEASRPVAFAALANAGLAAVARTGAHAARLMDIDVGGTDVVALYVIDPQFRQ